MQSALRPASNMLAARASAAASGAPQVRHFARKLMPTRIENKIGVGLRYRRPRTWDGSKKTDGNAVYSAEQIKSWRDKFSLPQMQHSLGTPSYSDEEILEWRHQFDKYCGNAELINLSSFQKMVAEKYSGILEEKQIPSKVMGVWGTFDSDGNNFIDFGEFLKASFKFDVDRLKEGIMANGGGKGVFDKYASDGFITEEQVFELMGDYKFTLATTSDMRKLIAMMDADNDGMVSEQDLDKWLQG